MPASAQGRSGAGRKGRTRASPATRTGAPGTRERILDAALTAFGTRGYETTSLDALAAELGVRKQTILYHFASKDALLDAVIDEAGAELIASLEKAVSGTGEGWSRVDAVVRSVFRLAGRRPELLGLLREVSRLGPPRPPGFARCSVRSSSGPRPSWKRASRPANSGARMPGCCCWPPIRR